MLSIVELKRKSDVLHMVRKLRVQATKSSYSKYSKGILNRKSKIYNTLLVISLST